MGDLNETIYISGRRGEEFLHVNGQKYPRTPARVPPLARESDYKNRKDARPLEEKKP